MTPAGTSTSLMSRINGKKTQKKNTHKSFDAVVPGYHCVPTLGDPGHYCVASLPYCPIALDYNSINSIPVVIQHIDMTILLRDV